MKKENRKMAQQRRAEERRKKEFRKKLSKILVIGIPSLAVLALVIVLIVDGITNNTDDSQTNRAPTLKHHPELTAPLTPMIQTPRIPEVPTPQTLPLLWKTEIPLILTMWEASMESNLTAETHRAWALILSSDQEAILTISRTSSSELTPETRWMYT